MYELICIIKLESSKQSIIVTISISPATDEFLKLLQSSLTLIFIKEKSLQLL